VRCIHPILFLLLVFIYTYSHSFEEYYTTPGTRAQGMAGNFVALATDSSAIWYNPAGLGFNSELLELDEDVTLEYGDYVIFDDGPSSDKIFNKNSHIRYAGVRHDHMGFAFFRPYEFFSTSVIGGSNYFVYTRYTELKFAYGYEIYDGIAIGSSLDMVIQDYVSDCSTCEAPSGERGYGYSLGVLAKHNFNNGLELRGGVTIHSDIELDNAMPNQPSRPSILALGGAVGRPIFASYLLVTAQREIISYNQQHSALSINDSTDEPFKPSYTRTGFGGEWAFYPTDNTTIFLRFGVASTQSVQAPRYSIFNKINVSTWGLGVAFENGLVLDIAIENRNITYTPTDYTEHINLTSYSMSWSF